MQRTVILILCMVGLLSCDNKTSRTEEDALVASHILFQGEDVDSLLLADRVADISFLALENNDSALIYEADKIRFAFSSISARSSSILHRLSHI